MGRTPHGGGLGRRAGGTLLSCDRRGSARSGAQLLVTSGGRAGRRLRRFRPGITSVSGADVIRRPTQSGSPRQDEEPPTKSPRGTETGRATARERAGAAGVRTVEEHSSRRPFPAGPRQRQGGGAPRAIARIEVRAIGSAVWLVRCFSRRGSLRIPAPALRGSRPRQPREPAPEGSCQLRPGAVAAAARRGTTLGRAAATSQARRSSQWTEEELCTLLCTAGWWRLPPPGALEAADGHGDERPWESAHSRSPARRGHRTCPAVATGPAPPWPQDQTIRAHWTCPARFTAPRRSQQARRAGLKRAEGIVQILEAFDLTHSYRAAAEPRGAPTTRSPGTSGFEPPPGRDRATSRGSPDRRVSGRGRGAGRALARQARGRRRPRQAANRGRQRGARSASGPGRLTG